MTGFRELMTRLGLTVNEAKTQLVKLPEESFDFLGYTIGRFYGRGGKSYIGTRPSKKSLRKLLKRIHHETSSHWNWQTPDEKVLTFNQLLRGWCGYFNQGPVAQVYRLARQYLERRVRRWLMRREQRHGTGYKRYPDAYLYGQLGLIQLPTNREAVLKAKA